MAEANRGGTAGRCFCKSGGNGYRRESQDAQRLSLELAVAELHRAGGRRFPDLQHDFGFRRAQERGNRNCAGARSRPQSGIAGVRGRSSALRGGRRGTGPHLGACDGNWRGKAHGRNGQRALREQPSGKHRDGRGGIVARAEHRNRNRGDCRLRPGEGGRAGGSGGSHGEGTPGISHAGRKGRDSWIAGGLAIAAAILSQLPPMGGKPVFGYAAALALVASATFAIPPFVDLVLRRGSDWAKKLIGPEGLVASRSLASSLRRTSVLVAALCTAVAMMTSVGIMVGSFRETVAQWMESDLTADLYLRPGGGASTDRHPTISSELPDKIAALPGRSEEHTSELQSHVNLVCRLLLEK